MDKSFQIFVNQGDSLTDGWSKMLNALQTRIKIIAISTVDISEGILVRFKHMHWCFPGTVMTVENDHEAGQFNGHFEYVDGVWKIKIVWRKGGTQKITWEGITSELSNYLIGFFQRMEISQLSYMVASPPVEELNKKMWELE